MDEGTNNLFFRPRLSRQETKADATTRAAQSIISAEAARREAKTERLRQARLTAEQAAPQRAAAPRKAAPKRATPKPGRDRRP